MREGKERGREEGENRRVSKGKDSRRRRSEGLRKRRAELPARTHPKCAAALVTVPVHWRASARWILLAVGESGCDKSGEQLPSGVEVSSGSCHGELLGTCTQGLVTPIKGTVIRAMTGDCDPVYGRCRCGLLYVLPYILPTKKGSNCSKSLLRSPSHWQFSRMAKWSWAVFRWSQIVTALSTVRIGGTTPWYAMSQCNLLLTQARDIRSINL